MTAADAAGPVTDPGTVVVTEPVDSAPATGGTQPEEPVVTPMVVSKSPAAEAAPAAKDAVTTKPDVPAGAETEKPADGAPL